MQAATRLVSTLPLRGPRCNILQVVEQLGGLYPELRPLYSAFARELRVADPDPRGNSDTATMLLALRGAAVGSAKDIAALPKAALFAERALGSFRSSWLDSTATWLAFKGCRGHYSHNDLDGEEVARQRQALNWGGVSLQPTAAWFCRWHVCTRDGWRAMGSRPWR